ncbi:MAG TPA: hypothetical protein VE944_30215 [Nostoc sp.]|uniref:hypothetical protein n=1 Tax=Nostoc sp. TaxID=1180 RepID=UPI002D29E1C3|nr:hypothetical protein [Nostoc sp.]HYX18564.1 hypothetical protein [Nostoc sp.]
MSASPNPEFKIGDRCTWIAAPDWWNPTGERIRAIEGEKVLLDYSALTISTSDLVLVQEVAK